MRRACYSIPLFITIFFLVDSAIGQKKWDNEGGDNLWTTAVNWDPDGVPASTDDVVFDNTFIAGSYTVFDTTNSAQVIHSCQIGFPGNVNSIMLVVGGATANVLTVNGGGPSALHAADGGILKNQSRNGTRGIKLATTADVFKMSGTGRYIHATTTSGSVIPHLTSGTSAANFDFAATSWFENRSGTSASFDSLPVYGNYEYNVGATKSAATGLTITGGLLVAQGTLGVGASSSNTFSISGNVEIDSGATFRGNSGTGTSTIIIGGSVTGAGTLQGSASSGGTTSITSGGDISSQIAFGSGTTSVIFSGGAPAVAFSPLNGSTPTVKNISIAAGKTVAYNPPNGINLSVASGCTLSVAGALDLGSHSVSGPGDIIVTGTLGLGDSLGLNGNIAMTGSKSYDGATFVFDGTTKQMSGSSLPSAITGVTISNPNGVTLSQSTRILGNLSLADGNIFLRTYTLTVSAGADIQGGSPTSYIVADSTGVLVRNDIGATPETFPVGCAGSYAPVTVSNAGTPDSFSVRLSNSFIHDSNTSARINLEWILDETTPGTCDATLAFQWDGSVETGTTFTHSKPIFIGRWNGSQWVQFPAMISGSGPYTASASGFSDLGEFSVGNDGALPVQIASFTGQAERGGVRLVWTTVSETNCYGFFVEKKYGEATNFVAVSDVIRGAGTSLQQHSYAWLDTSTVAGKFVYRLRQLDLDSDVSYSKEIEVDIGPNSVRDVSLPRLSSLGQNYPNPFNPTTNFEYRIANVGFFSLKIFDVLGREVATLVNEVKQPGAYSLEWDATGMPSGVYICKMTAGNFNDFKKVLLLK